MADEIVLLDCWPSIFGMRVRVALAEKGLKYESREEDLWNKSPLLLEMNPVHKKIPVLIHNGKPIVESRIIIEYIDEVWKDKSPLLPKDPYQRARARFLLDYTDKMLQEARHITVWSNKGHEEKETANELEEELGEKPYFGGEEFGYLDVAVAGFHCWFYVFERFAKFSTEEECPKLKAWTKRCMEKESVASSLPHPDNLLDWVLDWRKKHGVE